MIWALAISATNCWPIIRAPKPKYDSSIADYYGMISHMDAEMGRILDTLDDKNLRGDTIVIYTSDHGLGVGQHGLMGKQNLYDHSMRIPLIMRGAGHSRRPTI